MPSFTFLGTLALAFLSVTPALAGFPVDVTDNMLAKRQEAPRPRGRPNHALEYGYPFRRGDHSGTRAPRPVGGTKMTPGGYVDPRAPNEGMTCRYNNQCSTGIRNARAICTNEGVCSFRCLGRTVLENGQCTGEIVGRRCSYDRQCNTSVDNANGKCLHGYCTFACLSGFYASGSLCATADRTCGDETCPEINGGYSVCNDGKCSARCEGHLGYKQYCNGDNSVCQCINIAADINNCGAPGNVCPQGYNGKGRAYCARGTCGLSCHRLTKVTPRDGAEYCV